MSKDIGVTNAIGGTFDTTGEGAENRWEFQFEQASKKVSLNVYLKGEKTGSSALTMTELQTELNKSDVDQMIQWLYSVKQQLPE